jgi:hypothetical protein
MSPPCRRPATLTSGHHPEPDPELCPPGGPGVRARPQDFQPHVPGPSGPGHPGPESEPQGRR